MQGITDLTAQENEKIKAEDSLLYIDTLTIYNSKQLLSPSLTQVSPIPLKTQISAKTVHNANGTKVVQKKIVDKSSPKENSPSETRIFINNDRNDLTNKTKSTEKENDIFKNKKTTYNDDLFVKKDEINGSLIDNINIKILDKKSPEKEPFEIFKETIKLNHINGNQTTHSEETLLNNFKNSINSPNNLPKPLNSLFLQKVNGDAKKSNTNGNSGSLVGKITAKFNEQASATLLLNKDVKILNGKRKSKQDLLVNKEEEDSFKKTISKDYFTKNKENKIVEEKLPQTNKFSWVTKICETPLQEQKEVNFLIKINCDSFKLYESKVLYDFLLIT